MITFSLSILWTYETMIFGKIWTYTEGISLFRDTSQGQNLSKSPELEILSSK